MDLYLYYLHCLVLPALYGTVFLILVEGNASRSPEQHKLVVHLAFPLAEHSSHLGT